MTESRLSVPEDWSASWRNIGAQELAFDPEVPSFIDVHRMLMASLPKDETYKLLEIGCYPGTYMWYFHKHFGYRVSGLEYVDWCARSVEASFAQVDIEADVIEDDFFSDAMARQKHRFDVVFSCGFIEHFADTKAVLERHAYLCRPGGYIVILIPNHAGIYGRIMKMVAPEKHKMHNLMGAGPLFSAADELGLQSIARGYVGRLGFWNTCLYETVKPKGRLLYTLVRGPCWLLERGGRLLPNSESLSPNICLVAQVP